MIFMNIRHKLNECFMGPESLIKMYGYIICSAYKSHFMAACVNLVWSMPWLCEAVRLMCLQALMETLCLFSLLSK